jgi:MazG family protein
MKGIQKVNTDQPGSEAFDRLCAIMAQLRSAGGCPWDAQQTPASLKPFIIEEAYELLEAIDQGDPDCIKEELGDLLLQIVFQARIHEERTLFNIQDVILGLTDKLIRRHPHVFAPHEVTGTEHHEVRWEQIKASEKVGSGRQAGLLAGIPVQLPALQAAQKIYSKLSRHGYAQEAIINSHLEAPADADPAFASEAEVDFGQRLFGMIFEAQQKGINAEEALRKYNSGIQRYFSGHHHSTSD